MLPTLLAWPQLARPLAWPSCHAKPSSKLSAWLSSKTAKIDSRGQEPRGSSPDSYPHVTNGGEKQDERPQEGFATRASLSKWFANREDHHGPVPDSHPGGRPPSRRCPPSWWQATDQCAGPTPPASEAQSPQK